MINTRTAFRGEDNCRGGFTMTETDVRRALRSITKVPIHPIWRKLAQGRFAGSPLRTPSQCNERPIGKTKSVPTNTLVVNQIGLFPLAPGPPTRAPHSFPLTVQGADNSGKAWYSWVFQVETLQVPLSQRGNKSVRPIHYEFVKGVTSCILLAADF